MTETTQRILREREAAERAEALAELDRAKTAFFSNVSHEFRTPLTLMLGPLEELLRTAEDEQRPLLQSARRNALRLLKLVNTLLQFSALEAGRADAAFEETDLGAVTGDLTSVFRSAIESAGLRLVTEFAPVRNAFVDREMWEKIVLNLLSNALKFTLAGEIRVSVACAAMRRCSPCPTPASVFPKSSCRTFSSGFTARELHMRARMKDPELGSRLSMNSCVCMAARSRSRARLERARRSASRSRSEPRTWIPAHIEHQRARRADYLCRSVSCRNTSDDRDLDHASGAGASRPRSPSVARILLADDNRDLRDYVTHVLGSDYEVVGVPNGKTRWQRCVPGRSIC